MLVVCIVVLLVVFMKVKFVCYVYLFKCLIVSEIYECGNKKNKEILNKEIEFYWRL